MITQDKDTQFIPITTNTLEHTLMANVKAMENTSMLMGIDTKGPLLQTKNMELAGLQAKIKANTMVNIN